VTALSWAAFAAAAAAGAALRYLVDGWVAERTAGAFPWGTLVVNASGSFLAGLVAGWALYRGLGPAPRTVLATGFCGAYTTFSTFTFETVRLVEQGAVAEAARNVGSTAVAGALAAAAGLVLTAL